jgi:aminoglycoside phosphotransferase (APT) family kinase protein
MNLDILSFYKQCLNLQEASFSRIDHEDAMVAIVFKITQPNGEQLVLKVCDRPNDYFREIYFLHHFANALPVPKIIHCIEPTPDIHGAILMECLSGTLLKTEELTDSLATEIGRCLAVIHSSRLSGYGDPIDDLSSDPKTYFSLKFEEGLEECSHHLPLSLIEQSRLYYEKHIALLESVDGPCIVHRDYRPGNLIVQDEKLQGIIDWSGARASFAEEDFCSIEHGEWTTKSYIKKALLAGYTSIRPVPDYARLVPFLRLNKAIATIGFTVKRGTWKNSSAHLYRFNRQFLETLIKNDDNKRA